MFDQYAQDLFDQLPELPGLDPETARRSLSQAYLSVIQLRAGDTPDPDELSRVISYIRRLAHTMEFYAVLNEDVEPTVRQAGGFITGESLALLAEFYDEDSDARNEACRIHDNGIYTRIEAALLYLIASYDSNAASVLSGIEPAADLDRTIGEQGGEWCLDVLINFCRFDLNPLPPTECPVPFESGINLDATELEDDTIGRLFGRLGEAVAEFMAWLAGEGPQGMENAQEILNGLLELLGPQDGVAGFPRQGTGGDYARIRHLASLLHIGIQELSDRSVVHGIPPGPGIAPEQYTQYLKFRAQGSQEGSSGRPVLWPPAKEFIERCVSGAYKHAVVSVPTGSGKSFLAELALSQSVGSGWVLYLAPTNALTEQIRNDLRQALRPLQTHVAAFIGDREYSTLKTEVVSEMPLNSVAVMTPEKASLALRLYPDVFDMCRLVIFDECHLLGDTTSGRGVIAELLLSVLIYRVSEIKFLLMSAIVQNPQDLALWLEQATGQQASVLTIPWRPTRTLRSAMGIDQALLQERAAPAQVLLEKKASRFKNQRFYSPAVLVCGLQGAWQSTDELDYGLASIPYEANLKVTRKLQNNGTWKYSWDADSWVNSSTIGITSLLAERGLQTLAFTPASKHYPFSNASKTELSVAYVHSLNDPPSIVRTCQVLAEYEFGAKSEVFDLLHKGISVHTSHMIEEEKIASEAAFRAQSTRLMYATGTLAQGLNLPATAVVIAGTTIGYSQREARRVVEQRTRSQLLNAAGRAGRAGFSNQGLVIAVPDKPVPVDSYADVETIRSGLDYLQVPDNAVMIESALERFLDSVSNQVLSTETASDIELQTIAILSGGDEGQPSPSAVLDKTYASYRRRRMGFLDATVAAGQHLTGIRDSFIEQVDAPNWVTIAAQRAGLDYFFIVALVRSWNLTRPYVPDDVMNWSVLEWTEELLRVISNIPPQYLTRYIPADSLKPASPVLEELAIEYGNHYVGVDDWHPSDQWTEAWMDVRTLLRPWMEGRPLSEIAAVLTSEQVDALELGRNAGGKPIPKTLSLTIDFFSRLAMVAGGLVAVAEQSFHELSLGGRQAFERGVPLSLSTLPMCIKYGCDSPQSLAWYRFGVRLRRPSRLLYDAFPPPSLEDDEGLRAWVRDQRSMWLDGNFDETQDIFSSNSETFDAIAEFILQS